MKLRIHRLITTGAVFAALTAVGPQARAQSSDAIINKLVQKGLLTETEAADIRKEAKEDFSKAYRAETGASPWIEKMNFHGDFRGRLDHLSSDNEAFTDRYRLRYRLRGSVTMDLTDDFELGFGLGSSDAGGNALSNNSTLENNGTKKPLWVDLAYAKWTPLHGGDWTASATIGKMRNPFQVSGMEFDADYTPEGAALQAAYKFNNHHALRLTGGAFVLDEIAASSHDPFLLGAQAIWDAKWNKHFESSLGISAYDIVSKDGLATANVANNNTGNTRNADGTPAASFNPIILSGSATYKLDSVPAFHGAFPIKLAGEYLNNPAADDENQGWWAGVTFGSAAKKGNWELSYRYQRLEADAWYEEFVDDDNVGYFQTAGASDKSGLAGGTNIKGHLVKLNYAITDSLTFGLTGFFNELIDPRPAGSKSGATHLMADLLWKF
ncbi:MAG TPA: putative porin [Verrucomicrobiae bacterium]|nr:putative porin [Verrucomicrobiae bacterium]